MPLFSLSRRTALKAAGALTLATLAGRAAFAATSGERKLVIIILRGAMDGLAAIAAVGDRHYASTRGSLALSPDAVLALTDGFGLHPALAGLHGLWQAGEFAFLHAAASPYRDRSHFDAQDVLESGGESVFSLADGWLNRASALRAAVSPSAPVAIAASLPLILRGPAPATSWSPSPAPEPDEDTLARLMRLYDGDRVLEASLSQALATAELIGEGSPTDRRMARRSGQPFAYAPLAQAAAKLLSAEAGPEAAVLSFDGWDTHANQGAAEGQLARRLAALDEAITALRTGLGAHWAKTAVLVMTEFGRTVAVNGTGGTDHGTGGVAFLLGGAVAGGQHLGDWPGLAPGALYQSRDLAPANDLRALAAGVLSAHWNLEPSDLSAKVFPGLARSAVLNGLMRS